jgi:ketosteroid isomerase-like protein
MCDTGARFGGLMRARHVVVMLLCMVSLPLLAGQDRSVVSAGSVISSDIRMEVEQVLHFQQDAWNRHDLDSFMTGYWNSPELTFFSGARETSGWQGALERYRKAYQGVGKEMGKLEFSELRIEPLGSDSAFVRGAWHLTLSDGKTPHGLFTLVLRKFSDGWKIVHDHTSAE